MRHLFVFCAVLFACCAIPARAEQWQRIATTTVGTVYIDVDSIRRADERVIFWDKTVLKSPRKMMLSPQGPLVYATEMWSRHEVDCAMNVAATPEYRFYDADGNLLRTNARVRAAMPIAANSSGDAQAKYACKFR
jgi:hypothetical protein